jgi:hypothetical protein
MSSWETEQGGVLEEFTGTIVDAKFSYADSYMNGQQLLMMLEMEVEGEQDPERRERMLMYSVGSGWDAAEGGAAAINERGTAKFRRSSMYGRLIEFARNTPELLEELERRGDPTKAKVWEGLRFHMAPQKIEFGPGIAAQEKLLPVEYLGVAGNKTERANKEAEKQEAAVTSTSAESSTTNGSSAPNRKALEVKLKMLAKKSATHEEFVDAAVEMDGVTDDEELLGRVVDADGIFAEARA